MSRLPFELLLALRYLRPKRTFVSIITLISVLGVTLGVAVLIIVISVMSGFDQQLREKILGFNGHLKVYQRNEAAGKESTMINYALIMSLIASNQNVKGVAPFVMGPVVLKTEPQEGQPLIATPYVRGIDPQFETNVSTLLLNVRDGNSDLSGHGMLVGNEFAHDYNLQTGDHVSIYTPGELQKMEATYGKTNETRILPTDYEVRGIFDTGFYEYNSSIVVTSLENAQELFNLDDTVGGLMVMLYDPFKAETARGQLAAKLRGNYRISIWTEESSTMAAVIVEKNVMLYILFFIVIVAAFGITCTLITFVVLKTREIGVMKALGASSRQVMWVFLSQSIVVSIAGVLVGLGLGMLAVTYRNEFLHFMRRATGMELFPASIYGFSELPALILPGDIAIICGGSLLICLLAAAFPVWNASRLKPVEALRHE
ncbi:MAG TPA: ABC transporter permease [Verrucomicrobiae bacterium]|nr:ABC transporter permease [Verrucomicrobiae bacterium]